MNEIFTGMVQNYQFEPQGHLNNNIIISHLLNRYT